VGHDGDNAEQRQQQGGVNMKKTIEPGTYSARATAWAWDTTKDGKPYLTINLDAEGATVRGRLYFDTDRTDANGRTSAERSMEVLRAMGLRTTLRALVTGAERIDTGRVSVEVVHNDKGYPEAKYINAPLAPKVFAAPAREQMLELIAAVDGEGTTPTRPAPQRAPAPRQPPRGFDAGQGEDSIPF
jgi:hypothetical protein